MPDKPYLTVNVYPFAGNWQAVALLKTPGRPYPRLLRPIGQWPLPDQRQSLPEALRAAAVVLQQAADDLDRHPGA